MDGRDIGTAVFPNAELKIFVTASAEIRAQRRYEELKAKGQDASFEEILHNVEERDRIDQSRAVSPLRKADDAILLDNSHLTIAEQKEWLKEQFEKLHMHHIEIDKDSGFCFGVTTAISKAEEELAKGVPLYCLGDIVHNGQECERLKEMGLITINHEEFARLKNVKVLLRAHGEPPETYELARKTTSKSSMPLVR